MNPIQLCRQSSSDISIFSIKCFFICLLDLPQSLCLTLVGFYISGEAIKFFLDRVGFTSTAESRFLSDMMLIMFVSYKLKQIGSIKIEKQIVESSILIMPFNYKYLK